MISKLGTDNTLLNHNIPSHNDYPNDFVIWLAIAPFRKLGPKNIYAPDARLYAEYGGPLVQIGYGYGYMKMVRVGSQTWNMPLYNLYVYQPICKLHRINMSDLFLSYLHLSLNPYLIYISKKPHIRSQDVGTIAFQLAKRGI